MKAIGILLFLYSFFLFQCGEVGTSPQNAASRNAVSDSKAASAEKASETPRPANNMNDGFSFSGQNGDLKYEINAVLQKKGKYENVDFPNDNLVVNYTLQNVGKNDYVIYNQGHSDQTSRSTVYTEVLSEGLVELSQKQLVEPQDKQCPARFVAIIARAAWLKSGSTVSEKVYVEFPITHKTPFDDCGPIPPTPEKLEKVKFCIGYAPADSQKVTIDSNGVVVTAAAGAVSEQKFICSDVFSLPDLK